jgi:CheY-like chemotaxis protein
MSKHKILIVDDDPQISALMAAVLERKGNYTVRQENRSFAALATARAFSPDLVLLDVDMPGKDGGAVAAELSEDPFLRRVPVVFVTSLASKSDTLQRPSGPRGPFFLSKPPSPQLLLQTVSELLAPALAVSRV